MEESKLVEVVTTFGSANRTPTLLRAIGEDDGGCNSLLICSMVYAAIGVGRAVYGLIRMIGESSPLLSIPNGGSKYLEGTAMGPWTVIGV